MKRIEVVSAINAARKSEKNTNNDNADDGVRFFLMLDEFISYGEAVAVGQSIHNADWMSVEEARKKYEELKSKRNWIKRTDYEWNIYTTELSIPSTTICMKTENWSGGNGRT